MCKYKQKAKLLVNMFGKKKAIAVAIELLNRDKQWVAQLNKEYPDYYKLTCANKSTKMFVKLITEISKH